MMALSLLSKLKGYEPKGLNFLFYASFASILYDLFKKFYWSIPFFGLLGIGISLIGSIKYGTLGYLFGLLIIPIFLRELKKRGNKVEDLNSSSGSRKEDEI
jgi:predicted branched-subunit amino acid permease